MSSYPSLQSLSTAFLNQDWWVDYSSWEEAVDDFVAESDRRAGPLPGEIRQLLSTYDDAGLKDFIRHSSLAYRPTPDDGDYRTWLTRIAERVERRLSERSTEDGGGPQSSGD